MPAAPRLRPLPLILLILGATIVADLSFRWRPTGYFGGTTDDQRYVEAALAWIVQGPHAGTTHWSLRHPLVLAVAASFKTFGISIAAVQIVPRLAADLLVALTAGFVAHAAGRRAAILWVMLALASPILHEMATSCFPEMLELTFGAASLWMFWTARRGGPWSGALLAGSGVTLALAALTRETAVAMLPLYALAWARGTMPPRGMAWFAAGFLPPVLLDTLWLWHETGDMLYRLHVGRSHIGIFSDHLRGGTYHGRAFFNPDLAARWLPSGPVRLHWAVDPLANFLVDPRFGLIFAAWTLLWAAMPTRPLPGSATARAMPVLLGVALASYLVVTWVLTLRPQPRYYLFAVYAATIAVALLADQATRSAAASRLRGGTIGLVLLAGFMTISLAPDRQRDARVILPWLAAHPGVVAHLAPKEAGRLRFPAILHGLNDRISAAPPPVGGLRIVLPPSPGERRDDGAQTWQRVETLVEPRRFPFLNAARELRIERRVR